MTSKYYLILLSCFILKQALVAQVVPPPATQSEVDAGVNRFKYVTPYTLQNKPGLGGGSGGTNFPNVNLLLGNTNLALQAGKRTSFLQITNGNHGTDADLAVPESGHLFTLMESNSHTGPITNTFYTNGVAATFFDPLDNTNSTSWFTPAGSMTVSEFTYLGSGKWMRIEKGAPGIRFVAGSGITFTDGGVNGLERTITSTGGSGGEFNETNITVSTTNEIVIDVAAFDIVKVFLLTNLNTLSLTNVSTMGKRSHIYFQQNTNGGCLISNNRVAGGLLQTNANLQPTTNANALDLLEIMPGFFSSNAIAWWPQNFQPRVAFTNSLDDGVISCSAAGQEFLTINGVTASGSDYFATSFASDGQDICTVELNIAKAADETSDYFVELRSNSATNTPSQTVLGTSSTVLAAAIGTTTNYVTFTFPSTVSTSNGSTNWFVLRKTSSTAKSLSMGRASGSVNLMYASGDGIAWTSASTTRQGNYRTYKP